MSAADILQIVVGAFLVLVTAAGFLLQYSFRISLENRLTRFEMGLERLFKDGCQLAKKGCDQ